MHILTNISRRKGNQGMKFGELIEYNLRDIFLEKSQTTGGGDTIPRPFFKKLYSLFLLYASIYTYDYQNLLKLSFKALAFTSYEAFLKNKDSSETSLPASFPPYFF